METIFRLSSIWLRNYKKLRYLQGRNLKCLFSLEFISSTVKNNLFCATILHLTLPIYYCLGNKSKNKLKRRKPKKILVNIYISKLRLDWSEKNPAKNKTYGFWVACTDFSYFPFLKNLFFKRYFLYQTIPNFQVVILLYSFYICNTGFNPLLFTLKPF